MLGRQMNVHCKDMEEALNSYQFYIDLASLRDSLNNQSISSCREVTQHCNDYFQATVRMFCPQTCNCTDPTSSLALPFPANGCPTSCLTAVRFQAVFHTAPC